MSTSSAVTAGFVQRFLGRLRFPQLFTLLAVLFGVDLILPDFIPFFDEIFLALLMALVGSIKRRQAPPAAPPAPPGAPAEKNVTPGG